MINCAGLWCASLSLSFSCSGVSISIASWKIEKTSYKQQRIAFPRHKSSRTSHNAPKHKHTYLFIEFYKKKNIWKTSMVWYGQRSRWETALILCRFHATILQRKCCKLFDLINRQRFWGFLSCRKMCCNASASPKNPLGLARSSWGWAVVEFDWFENAFHVFFLFFYLFTGSAPQLDVRKVTNLMYGTLRVTFWQAERNCRSWT